MRTVVKTAGKRKTLAVILSLMMMFTIFAGMSVSTSAAVALGTQMFTKDFTFETQTVGVATSGMFNYGSAVATALVIAGGANGTAKALNVPSAWNIVASQQQSNPMTAGLSYRLSTWIKGAAPLKFQLVINTGGGATTTINLVDYMTVPVTASWQLYSYDFIAPVGAPAIGAGSSYFDLQIQSAAVDFQFDEVSLVEISALPTPTVNPNITPTPVPTAVPTVNPNSTPTPTPAPTQAPLSTMDPINLLAGVNADFEAGGWGANLTATTVNPGQGLQSGVAAAGGWTGKFLGAPQLLDNTTYTFSYLVKTDGTPANCLVLINYKDGATDDFKSSGPAYTGNSTTWTKYTSVFTTGSGVKKIDAMNWVSLTCWSGTQVYIDDIQLHKGKDIYASPTPTPTPGPATPTPTPSPTPDPNATPTPTPDLSVPQKIMCIGDSITQGSGGVGNPKGPAELSWRYPLWKLLIDSNAKFEFVGSRNTGFDSNATYPDYNGNVFSNKHEGYWGWTIQSVTTALTTPLTTITPDIAIIYLGTNNAVPNETVAAKVAAMRLLIEKLRTANPSIKILLGKPSQTWFGEMQTAYGALATELTTVQSPIIAVQNAPGWVDDPTAVGTCTNDWVHTNTVGDQKMANVIFPVLAAAMGVTPATPTPVVTASPTPTPVPVLVTAVLLSKTTAALKVPMTLQLTATVLPANATNKAVTWTSSNVKVAIVSTSGKVTAKGPGTAVITVKTTDGNFTRTCKVTVTQPVKSVKLNKKTASISKGKTVKLVATISPVNASNKKVTWKSSSTKIAKVSTTGIVKGIKKGTCYITVTTVDGKKTAKCKVTVK